MSSSASQNSSSPMLGLSSAVTEAESFKMGAGPAQSRRTWMIACGATGGVAAAAVAVPFLGSMAPSEKARSAGAPVEVDIADIPVGGVKIVEWRGKPVWIVRRTPEMLESLAKSGGQLADPDSNRKDYPTPEYAKNQHRSIKPEFLVAVGICTHLGCSPVSAFTTGSASGIAPDWPGGFFCPCHGSTFDMAGRVYANKPAPDNLEVPRHMFLTDSRIVIGKDEQGEA
jgi:ubiquinol-cytochrome c reductase iron-sulfur subunit